MKHKLHALWRQVALTQVLLEWKKALFFLHCFEILVAFSLLDILIDMKDSAEPPRSLSLEGPEAKRAESIYKAHVANKEKEKKGRAQRSRETGSALR